MPDWLQIVVRTLAAVVILFIMTKLLGKRQLSELSLFEYITGISIGNIAAYISLDLDNLWYLGFVSLTVWVSISVGIELWTVRNKKVRNIIDGKGRVLIRNGKLLKQELRRERLTLDELLEQLRSKDVYRVADVEFAIMEASGELNIQLKKEHQPLTPAMLGWQMSSADPPTTVVMDGAVLGDALKTAGKNMRWLESRLNELQLRVEDVLIAQIDGNDRMIAHAMDGKIHEHGGKDHAAKRIAQLTEQLRAELARLDGKLRSESERQAYEQAVESLRASLPKL